MDYDNDKTQKWDWHRKNCERKKDSNCDPSGSLWTGEVAQNEEDLSYMLDDEATPVKACGDLAYQAGQSDNLNNESLECKESFSQIKRRRMLQFTNDNMDSALCCDEISTDFLQSNERVDSIEEALSADWVACFEENSDASMYDALDQSAEWIRDCFNDTEMDFSPDTVHPSSSSNLPVDVTEFCEVAPEHEHNVPQQPITTPRRIIFKGKKSFLRTPTTLPSSVAYPFAFIKPSGAHGDVTLKDINQKIRTPPPSKSKQNSEDLSALYPTSAFSGKPVVGKTKIRTEGGKGSITIMRTKG